MSTSTRGAVLRHYRELMEVIACIPKEAERVAAREQARAAVRANKDITNPIDVSDKMKEMVAKTSFLRMTTPRDPRRLRRRESSSSGPAHHSIIAHGQCPCRLAWIRRFALPSTLITSVSLLSSICWFASYIHISQILLFSSQEVQ